MAYLFSAASSQWLDNLVTPTITGVPFTMCAWTKPTSAAYQGAILALQAWPGTGATTNRFILEQYTDGKFYASQATDVVGEVTGPTFTNGVWTHVGGVFTSNSSRTMYVDGASQGTNTTVCAGRSGINALVVGAFRIAPTTNYLDGAVAEAAIWDVALTAAEMALLGKGYSPLFVRPENLVNYWPLSGRVSPTNTIDRMAGFELLPTNSPTFTDHPRIIYPSGQRRVFTGTIGGGGSFSPFWAHQKTQIIGI